tara:strand:- start:778 stop:1260 length:483 start_codon:yes stop_codon:yes gene_type:complete
LLEKYSPKNCIAHAGKLATIEDAINSKAPSIASFQREHGRQFTEGLVTFWLLYLNKILNLNKPMSEEQINLCSGMVVEEFYMLKVSDLTLLFKRIISGQYGEFYERLSIDKILTFFRAYLEERFELAESNSIRNHNEENKKTESTISEGWKRRAKKITFK